MSKILRVSAMTALAAVAALGLTASAATQSDPRSDQILAMRLDQSLLALHRARAMAGSAAEQDRIGARRLAGVAQATEGSGGGMLSVLVQHTTNLEQLQHCGLVPQATIGQVTSGTVAADRLAELALLPGVQRIELSRTLTAFGNTPAAPPHDRAALERGAIQARLTTPAHGTGGAGVLIAFIDTGVDIFHHDLRHEDGSTRIRSLLDLAQPGDVDGDGILDGDGPYGGTLYSEVDINDALAAGDIAHHDTTGHGTHELSIAAGDDAAFPGMAPAADLIVVAAAREPGSLSFTSGDLVNALAFVDAKAAELGQPYVVNLSLGTLFSSHDGRSLEELAIDALVGPGKAGKAVVAAAGSSSDNRSSRFHHLSGTAYSGLTSSHSLIVDPFTPGAERGDDRFLLDLWWQGNDRLAISVTGPAACGAPEVTAAYGSFRDVATPCGDVFIANMGGVNPLNGDTEAIVLVDDWSGTAPTAGTWTLSLTGEEIGAGGEYQGWLAESQLGGTSPFLSGKADNHSLVGKPGGAHHAITVGSHADDLAGTRFATSWTDVNGILRSDTSAVSGDISDFSSPGPTRDGRIKPELTAPGEWVRGAVSRDAYPGVSADSVYRSHPWAEPDALIVDDTADNAFGMLQGTSFSAPVVTGLVARILSTDPSLDAIKIRNILLNSAVADSHTGTVPNPEWGYGKANLSVGTTTLPSNLHINAEQPPNGVRNQQYNHVLTASGGTPPYTWWLIGGTLPTGLGLDATGFLSGVPIDGPGYFVFTAGISDGSQPQQTDTQVFMLTIDVPARLEISRTAAPTALIGESYDSRVEASGGDPPYTFSLAGGSLPDGLVLLADGTISGEPTTLGSFPFTVRVEDFTGVTALRSMGIRVDTWSGDLWHQLGRINPRARLLAVDPNNPERLFSFVDHSGVYQSNDGGDSWEIISLNNGFPIISSDWSTIVWDMEVSPASGDLYATVTANVTGRDKDLLRFNEAAGVWASIPLPADAASFRERVRFDTTGSRLFAFGYYYSYNTSKLLLSLDGGDSWEALSEHLSGSSYHDVSLFEASPATMYLTLPHYIIKTTDGGQQWSEITNGSGFGGRRFIEVSQADSFDVVVLNDSLWRSVDGGRNWIDTDPPIYTRYYSDDDPDPNRQDLERSFSDPDLLLLTDSSGALRSDDGGSSWERLAGGLPSTRARDIEMVGDDPNHLVVATDQGIYLTLDSGASWQQKSGGLQMLELLDVAVSSQDPEQLVLLSHMGPLLSENHGDTWTLSISGLSDEYSGRLELSPADEDLVYLIARSSINSAESRLHRTDNHGITWVETSPGFEWGARFVAVAADPFNSELVLAAMAGTKGVYRSNDRGATWTAAYAGLPFAEPTGVVFAADVEGRLYLSYNGKGIYRSEDRGTTWTPYGLNSQTVTVVCPAPSDSEYLYAATEDATWFLDPAFGTWQQSISSPVSPIVSMAVHPTNHLVAYAGADHTGDVDATGGVYATADGGSTWSRLAGLDQLDVVSLVIDPSDPTTLFAATRHGGTYRSEDAGLSWIQIYSYGTVAGHVNVIVQHPTLPKALLAGTDGFGVQISMNNGSSFSPYISGLGNLDINAILFNPDDETIIYAGSASGIFVSTDWVSYWSRPTWEPTALTAGEVTAMAADNDGSGQHLWATVRTTGIAHSADGGATFSTWANGLQSLELTGLAVEHRDGGRRLWVTMHGGNGVAYSTDDGQTWLPANGNGLDDRNVNDVEVDVQGERIWVTTDSGVLYTEDAGLSWHPLSQGLPAGIPVSSISIDPLSGEAFVSLGGTSLGASLGGVYRGGNTVGVWSEYDAGMDQLPVGRLTNDGGQTDDTGARTTFFASTRGAGVWSATVEHPTLTSPVITTVSLADAMATRPYTVTLAAGDGSPPYHWSVVAGAMPPGLVLNADTGVISGAAALPGTATFTVQVADACRQTASAELSITVQPFASALFADGFESSDTSAWSKVVSQ